MEPRIVIGGNQHKSATSFQPVHLKDYEKTYVYRNQKALWLMPSLGTVPTPVMVSFLAMQWPMNQFRSQLICIEGMEVGAAYNKLFEFATNEAALIQAFGESYGKSAAAAPFIVTTEEDNIIPADGVLKLFEAIYTCPDCGGEVGGEDWLCREGHRGLDAVSGLYFVKGDPPIPMAFGNPKDTTEINYWPQSVEEAIEKEALIEVYGIAMGFALWRKALFAKMSNTEESPWFQTVDGGWTQDLWACDKAKKEAGARFGVHCGVRVGHYDAVTKQIY